MIRIAKAEDAPKFSEIYRPYVEKSAVSFETEAPDTAEFCRRIKETEKNYPWIVLEEDGKILGYAYAHRYRERKAYDWAVESSIYLADEAKHQKIGDRLYKSLMCILKEQGVLLAYAFITSPNPESENFHLRFGFERESLQKKIAYKNGAFRDLAVMRYEIGPFPEIPQPLVPFEILRKNPAFRLEEKNFDLKTLE
jgi:phosphinothricin acetyltransferase